MNSVSDAHLAIEKYLLAFLDGRDWDVARVKFSIFGTMVKGEQYLEKKGILDGEGGFANDTEAIWVGLDAVSYLKNYYLAVTGRRIWGLTFTLYPGGKYEIEYDYNKPADYEDTEDTISGDEINQSLGGLLATEPLPMQMTAEQAYQAIGQCVFQAQDEAGWHLAGVDLTYQPGRQVRMHFWQETAAGKQRAPKVPDHAAMVAAADGAYALYDSLTSQGGAAPDGLSFTLTPEGRMKLDYRYPDV